MAQQPNCPWCKHEKFVVSTYTLHTYTNPNDKNDYYLQTELLCCESCGAVICQYDREKSQRKLI
jgi:transcription elongation factor Elf1